MQRTAKLFKNGRSQAVRLPSEFRFDGGEVDIRKDPVSGDVVLSKKAHTWNEFYKLRDAVTQEELDQLLIPRDSTPIRVPKLS